MNHLARSVLNFSAGLIGGVVCLSMCRCSVLMPGDSFRGQLPLVKPEQASTADQLRADVQVLAGRIGERNVFNPDKLAAAEDFCAASLGKAGYQVQWQTFEV